MIEVDRMVIQLKRGDTTFTDVKGYCLSMMKYIGRDEDDIRKLECVLDDIGEVNEGDLENDVDEVVEENEVREGDGQVNVVSEQEERRVIIPRRKNKRVLNVTTERAKRVVNIGDCGDCKKLDMTVDWWFFRERLDLKCVGSECGGRSMKDYLMENKGKGKKNNNIMFYCSKVMRKECEVVMCYECHSKREQITQVNTRGEGTKRVRKVSQKMDL